MESNDRNDALVRANMESFAAALDAGRARVDGPDEIRSLVAVLDGTDQDRTTLALVTELAHTRELDITLTCGVLRGDDAATAEEERILEARDALARDGLTAHTVLAVQDESHERILTVLRDRSEAWLLLPSPFGHAFDELSHTTLSTTVEVCLTQGGTPTLLVRGPLGDAAGEPIARPHLIVHEFDRASARAARTALGLLGTAERLAGQLTVTFVYGGAEDPDVDDAVAEGFGLMDSTLMPLLSRGLSALLHRLDLLRAQHDGLEVMTRLVHPGGELIDEDVERGHLHVVPLRATASGVPESVHHFVLTTSDPVLVVPAEALEEAPDDASDDAAAETTT